jgi:tRNA(Ile)-lysidine synthase
VDYLERVAWFTKITEMNASNIDSIVLEEIARALERIGLRRDDRILLAISGGADSVALLHALLELRSRFGYRLACAHLNHRLRGDESDRDERFVRELCARLEVHLTIGDAPELEPSMPNLEERARDVRHAFLRRTADSLSADFIALAHHGDDQAETVVLRLLRGTGVTGLCAMAPAGPEKLIRPMLAVSREQIGAYLDARGVTFVSDSSNVSPAIVRNRVRLELMPMLERDFAPGLRGRLVELADEMNEVSDLMNELAQRELDSRLRTYHELELTNFAVMHPALQRAMIRSFIAYVKGDLRGIGRIHVDSIRRLSLEGPPNGQLDLGAGWKAEREYGRLRLVRGRRAEQIEDFQVTIAIPGRTLIESAALEFAAEVVPFAAAELPAVESEALLDYERIDRELVVRNFKPGDRIVPIGMDGSRKVKRIFIDRKLPRPRRASFPIVTMGRQIVWLPGLARGNAALLSSNTRKVLRLSVAPVSCLQQKPHASV